ncbi:hypothetical protein CAPTEDRAFT_228968 [Capitella teleta]|uniref:Uncharacterized protein n=1 Tax=Capitella teleta TaxID=283909 RepID=R7VK17_CAPTE|nr:hypothetical protein CAPTEDRAFT_228968 [Capitella teleta]|eukprot:ELU16961.1 hypothetical protein CAPTEDRAFT_228968 [Capitella teleta]
MKAKRPTKACMCAMLTVWILLAGLVLIITSLVYLKPLLRVISYRRTSCLVQNVFYTTQYVCSCGEGCTSYYPCFMIHVSINVTSSRAWTVILYTDTEQQDTVTQSSQKRRENADHFLAMNTEPTVAESHYGDCSIMVCKEDPQDNRDAVAVFQETYGQRGSLVPCYYAPWDVAGGAVMKRIHPGLEALHAVLWPMMCLIMGLGLCVIFCKKCRQIENLDKRDGDPKPEDTENAESVRTPIIKTPNCSNKASTIGKKRKQRSLRSLWMDT